MENQKRFSKIANNYPSFQEIKSTNLNGYKWLKSRRVDDKAEGLWRIHDSLYDLTEFIDRHPGGPDWIKLTKGTDITEAFEVHHINYNKAQAFLSEFQVREAAEPRNFKLTFKETGFYRTLKQRVAEKLKTIDKKPEYRSKIFIDSLMVSTFLSAILATKFNSIPLMLVSSLCLCYTVISAHNYFHQRDNFRMFYFNLSFLSYKEWRISHAMSHHLYPNSLHDMEISFFEPFLCWFPGSDKKTFQRYGSWVYSPVIYSSIFLDQIVKRTAFSLASWKNFFHISDLIPLTIPLAMFMLGRPDIIVVIKIWVEMIIVGSFIFGFIGLNAGHHHPDNVHDGDKLREDMDWGIYTIDTVMDITDFRKHHFLALTHFGHHALHHLFPTLDHGILDDLYPVLFETMAEFEVDLEAYPWYDLISGQLKQLARIKTNPYDSLEQLRMKQMNKKNKQI